MHVAVFGAGYAGVTLTRLLERRLPADVDITLVDESPDHLVQHELHRVVRRPTLANDITVSLTEVVDRATVEVATVEEIDRESRTVELSNGSLSFDVGVVCLGAETAFHGLEDVRERATPLKRLAHAREIRRDFFDAIEAADPRIVVGGAGLSGVQVAGELAELAREEGVADRARVTVLEQLDAVAPGFPARFQRAVRRALENLDVEVRTGTTVTGADDGIVRVDGDEPVSCDQLVWTGGIRGSSALAGDRPTVEADLRLDERTFACGDAARVIDDAGEVVPASAQSAVREARTVARNVEALVEHERSGSADVEPRLDRFRFRSPGWLVSVGDDAVAKVGPMVLTGRAARTMKATVGAGYLSSIGGYRNAVGLTYAEVLPDAGGRS